MFGVHTNAVVAFVQDASAVRSTKVWNRPVVKFIANAVSGLLELV